MSTDEDFLDFKCPYCGELVSYPSDSVGYARECFNCLESIIVPPAGESKGRRIPLPLTTPRLVLRRFHANDWKPLMELAANEEFLLHADGLTSNEESQVLLWLEGDRQIKLTTPGHSFRLAVTHRDENRLIGLVALRMDLEVQATIAITLLPEFRRQGLGLEALQAFLEFCFKAIKLHRVLATCESTNAAACHLFEKAGLRREAEFVKDHRTAAGVWMNSYWYALLEEDYLGGGANP